MADRLKLAREIAARGRKPPIGSSLHSTFVVARQVLLYTRRASFLSNRERLANHLVCIALPHPRLRSLKGGKNGRSTHIGIFWVPSENEARCRRIGIKGVLRGFVHPACSDHHWGSLVTYRRHSNWQRRSLARLLGYGGGVPLANQLDREPVPEPSWWMGFLGVM
jgi:hypothetical protein